MKPNSMGVNVFVMLVFLCHFAAIQARADSILNGDFETGDLTGWFTFTTANGTLGGPGFPHVELFDTDNDGVFSLAAQFRVGLVMPPTGVPGGGGIFQNVIFSGGPTAISVDIASSNTPPGGTNLSGGQFDLLFDGILVASHDFGSIAADTAEHSVLAANLGTVGAGSHEIRLNMTRPFLPGARGGGVGVIQYIDNVRLSSVPEPSTLWLLGSGLAGLVLVRLKQRSRSPM